MAQREDFLTPGASITGADTALGGDRSSDQIRSDIDRTRAELDETFSALESKLTPGQIMEEAWASSRAAPRRELPGSSASCEEHPLPAAVIGLGAGWLLVESSRKSESREDYGYDYDYNSNRYGRSNYGPQFAGVQRLRRGLGGRVLQPPLRRQGQGEGRGGQRRRMPSRTPADTVERRPAHLKVGRRPRPSRPGEGRGRSAARPALQAWKSPHRLLAEPWRKTPS